MAVSEKFANFSKKRPHHGLLGKTSSSIPEYKIWSLFTDGCDLLVPSVEYSEVYTSTSVTALANDVVLYTDIYLTTPLVNNGVDDLYFWYQDPTDSNPCSFFIPNSGGNAVNGYSQCYREWMGYSDCEMTIPISLYTKYSETTIQLGVQMYTSYTGGQLSGYYTGIFLYDSIGWQVGGGTGIIYGFNGC